MHSSDTQVVNGSQKKLFRQLKEVFDFRMHTRAWHATRPILVSVLVSSFLINLLSLAFPLALLQIYDRIIPNQATSTLTILAIGVLIALFIEFILRICRSYVTAWADAKFEFVTGVSAFKHLIQAPIMQFEKDGPGVHLKRINALNQLRDFYSGQAVVSIADMPFIILLLTMIAIIGHWLVLLPVLVLVGYVLATVFMEKNIDAVVKRCKTYDDHRFNFVIEALSNIHTVKALAMEAQMMRRYERLQRASTLDNFAICLRGGEAALMGFSVSQLTIVLVVSFGSILVINGLLSVGALVACTILSGRTLQPINALTSVWSRLKTIDLAQRDLTDILKMPNENPANAAVVDIADPTISLRNVSFGYDDDKFLFENINLDIKSGDTIAITGDSLVGKSTLCWLMAGILHPQQGVVSLGGADLSQVNTESYREHIGFMPQQAIIFNGTIMENVTDFSVDEYYDRGKALLQEFGLSSVIEALPDGYETVVGNQAGEVLPLGIMQRIVMARALIHDPSIVIFDEANSAVDYQGDQYVKRCLEKMTHKKTMVIVSYRPSILQLADKHYVMRCGKLELQS